MLIDRPELDTDVEWMLQSGQANDQVIIETLVNEFYAYIFRFSLSCLGVNQQARDATLESLATALIESHRYSGKEGTRLWLLSIAAKICSRAFRKSSDPKYPSVSTSQKLPAIRSLNDETALLWRSKLLGVIKISGRRKWRLT